LATVVHAVALASAWAYNAGLKNSPASALPYVVSFGLLPSIASLARQTPELPAWWVYAAGALLGVAAHFANVLPDFDDDRRTGVRGLPHRIGPAASVMLAVVGIVVAAIAVLIGSLIEGASPLAMIAFALLVAGIAAAVMIRMRRRGPDRTGFRLVMLAALVLALQLVVASGAA
jgi:4-hydroxybenzoate polyprenyltransferase